MWALCSITIEMHSNFFAFTCEHQQVWGFPSDAVVKNPPAVQETRVWSLGQEAPLEEGMATHSIILAWRILWTEEPGRAWSTESQRVRHYWSDLACMQVYTQNVLNFYFINPSTTPFSWKDILSALLILDIPDMRKTGELNKSRGHSIVFHILPAGSAHSKHRR